METILIADRSHCGGWLVGYSRYICVCLSKKILAHISVMQGDLVFVSFTKYL